MTGRDEAMAHAQARALAAELVDGPLVPEEAAWLDAHLASCPDCSAVAAEYAAIHAELSTLAMPEPPRDLWARTRAALDQVDGRGARSLGRHSRAGLGSLLGSSIAVATVVVIAGAALLSQTPIVRPALPNGSTGPIANASSSGVPQGAQQPLAVMNGTTYWIAASDGVYQIIGGTSTCDPGDTSCTVKNGSGQTLGTISSDSTVSAAIAPDASVAAVWTADKIAILPLDNSSPSVALDLLTPQPTVAVTASPTASPTPVRTATPIPATATPAVVSTPVETASAAEIPSPTLLPSASATPAATLTATAPPSIAEVTPVLATPTAAPTTPATTPTGGAVAILTGYEIVGSGPAFSADGKTVAFSARPSDHSAGPDVFVWQAGDLQAHAITSAHADYFSGWFGSKILVSEIDAGSAPAGSLAPTSFVFDPNTDQGLLITRPMFMPVVDPTGRFVVYWSGSVQFDPATGLWQPGSGDLYFDRWSNLVLVTPGTPLATTTPTATIAATPEPSVSPTPEVTAPPSAPASETPADTQSAAPAVDLAGPSSTPIESPFGSPTLEPSAVASVSATPAPTIAPLLPQLLPVTQDPGAVQTWQVRWDAGGLHLAIWVADQGSTTVGGLKLFSVDRTAGLVDTDLPLLAAQKVLSNMQFDSANLLYTLATDGKTYLQAVPPQQSSGVATAAPTDSTASSAPTPPSTDRPGN